MTENGDGGEGRPNHGPLAQAWHLAVLVFAHLVIFTVVALGLAIGYLILFGINALVKYVTGGSEDGVKHEILVVADWVLLILVGVILLVHAVKEIRRVIKGS